MIQPPGYQNIDKTTKVKEQIQFYKKSNDKIDKNYL